MFVQRQKCWLRSFPELTPETPGPVRTGSEFEVVGSAGGRYPLVVTEWNSKIAKFAFREGPPKNPPTKEPSPYMGATYAFAVVSEDDYLVIDATYTVHYRDLKSGRETTDPVSALEWALSGIPVPGKVVFVHAA
ncbi:MAG TPA: hypothetical protein VGC79_05790, partial [Polyangiaceae bacterium]